MFIEEVAWINMGKYFRDRSMPESHAYTYRNIVKIQRSISDVIFVIIRDSSMIGRIFRTYLEVYPVK